MPALKQVEKFTGKPGPKYGHLSGIHPEFAPLKEAADNDFAELWKLPLDEFRNTWNAMPEAVVAGGPEPGKEITITHMKVLVRDGHEVEIRIYKHANPVPNATLVFNTHGGGWVVGTHGTEEGQNRLVAFQNKAVVVSPDYRMGPEFKYPYAVNDSFDVLKWCISNASKLGIDPSAIILSGGSAGGNLAAVLALKARDQKIPGIIGQVLNIPVTCHPSFFSSLPQFELLSLQQNCAGSVVDKPKMQWFWDQYLPDPNTNVAPKEYHSPLLAKDLTGLPPALLQIAGADPLRDEAFAYAERLMQAGVKTTVRAYGGLPHGFYFFPQVGAAGQYLQEVSDFVRSVSASQSKL